MITKATDYIQHVREHAPLGLTLVVLEPSIHGGSSVIFVKELTAVLYQKKARRRIAGTEYDNDVQALEDFILCQWATYANDMSLQDWCNIIPSLRDKV